MDSNDDTKINLSERRRAIYERAVEKYRTRGTPIGGDPLFVSLMEEWIAGKIEMSEVADRSSPRGRQSNLRVVPTVDAATDRPITNEQLFSELDRIIGIHDLLSSSDC